MATEFGFSFGKMPKAGGKRLTNRTIGRYNVKTLGLKSSENKNGEREYEAGGIESCSRFGFGARGGGGNFGAYRKTYSSIF